MTALLGISADNPGACAACGRRAGAFGIIEKRHPRSTVKPRTFWFCHETCIPFVKKVMSMSKKDLDSFEQGIIVGAIDNTAESIVHAIVAELYEANVRSLEDLDAATMATVVERVKKSEAFHDASADLLLNWGKEAKRQIETGAPF